MKLLEGKRGLVFGVANDKSIAWAISKAAHAHGARLGFGYLPRMERRVLPLAESVGAELCRTCDLTDDAQIEALFAEAAETMGGLDFLVHSVAFADRQDLLGRFSDTSRPGWAMAMDVSAYTLVALSRAAAPLMSEGGSIITMTYYGAEKVIANYNVMGPAKAALEASVRYLASDLGGQGIRVNALSAGPIKTLAAAGIPGFRAMLKEVGARTALKRNVDLSEVADSALFLLSGLARGVTGEVLHVDAGYHAMGH